MGIAGGTTGRVTGGAGAAIGETGAATGGGKAAAVVGCCRGMTSVKKPASVVSIESSTRGVFCDY